MGIVNPGGCEIKTVGSKVEARGFMTNYFRKGINTQDPEGLGSTILNSKPAESPEEEVSIVINVDTLKLVDKS